MTAAASEDFRPLDLNEIEAVSGGLDTGNCNGKVITVKIAGKGTLNMGYDECEGLPGVKLPWAIWTPGDGKQ